MHNAVAETLVQVRSRYWIVKGRQTVKRTINKCVLCKKREGRPYGTPPTSQLPGFRLSDEFAFTSIGIDFSGPVYVKDIYCQMQARTQLFLREGGGVHFKLKRTLRKHEKVD